MGYDGKNAWTACRAHNAITSQLNPVDLTRRSPSYEMRLAKYAKRGFEVAVPELQRSRVDPMIFERAWSNVNGLGKLLLLEKLTTPEARFQVLILPAIRIRARCCSHVSTRGRRQPVPAVRLLFVWLSGCGFIRCLVVVLSTVWLRLYLCLVALFPL